MPQYNPYYQDPKTQTNDGDKISQGLSSSSGALSAINPVLGLIAQGASLGYKGHAGLKKIQDADPSKMVDSYSFNGDINAAPQEFDWQDQENPFKQSNVNKNRALGLFAWTPKSGIEGIKTGKINRKKRAEFDKLQKERYAQALGTHQYLSDRYKEVQRDQETALAQNDFMARRYQNAFNIPMYGQTMI